MKLNDIRLTGLSREVKNNVTSLDELTAQGKLDPLYDAYKAIRDAADNAMTRIGQIENGL